MKQGSILSRVRMYALVAIATLPLFHTALAADSIVIGIFPRRNMTETVAIFTPLAEHLTRKLKRPVVVESARDGDAFWQAVASKRFDVVHLNQYHYVKAHKLFGYNAIAKNQEHGRDNVQVSIVARADRGIKSIADLRGKTIVFGGGREAMQSYIVATHLLRKGGLEPGSYTETFALNPPNAILTMFRAQADATTVTQTCLRESPENNSVPTITVATSARYPHLPWATASTVSSGLRQAFQKALLSLNDSATGLEILAHARLTGISPASDREYDPARALIREILNEHY